MNNKMQNDRPLSIGGLRRRKGLCRFLASVAAAMFLFVSTAPAFADPTSVLGGNAILTGMHRATLDANDANAAAFSSSAASAVLDWSKFNVGAGQSMSFNGASTTFFNLVDGAAGKSQIDGIINGSGNVWVINPAGIAFGAGSSVNVGGLFAAAAGNVENAAALRDGTATMPSFSSFAGTVDASKGSFTANQVALMGKTVTTAGGDFSGTKGLSVAASTGAMTVDEVEGGKVSVDISDFAADDAEVVLGNLHIDGSLSVRTTGQIASPEKSSDTFPGKMKLLTASSQIGDHESDHDIVIPSEDIKVEADDIEIIGRLHSKGGDVEVTAYGTLTVNGDIEAYQNVDLQALEGIDVNADVTAHYGDAVVYAYNGSVTIAENSTVSAGGNVDITAGIGVGVNGDVTINGNVESSSGNVYLYSGYGYQSTGDVTINGNVTAHMGGVEVWSREGDVTVNGGISAMDSAYGYAYINAAQGSGSVGDIVVNGTVESGVETLLGAGYDFNGGLTGGKGAVTVNNGGTVLGEYGSTYVWAAGGNGKGVDIGGEVRGYRVVIDSRDETGVVAKDGAKITAGFQDENGDVVLPGKLSVDARSGNVELSGAKITTGTAGVKATGEIYLTGFENDFMGVVEAEGTSVSIVDANDLTLGDVKATAGTVVASTHDGNITIAEGKTVESSMPYYGYDLGSVTLVAGTDENSAGGILVNGTVKAAGDLGAVTLESAAGAGSVGDVKVNGLVQAGYMVQVGAGYDELAQQTGGKGSVNVSGTGKILTEGDAYVLAAGGSDEGIKVSGIVAGAGRVTVATSGDKGVTGMGILEGDELLNVYANSGVIDFSGMMFADAADLSASDGVAANNPNNDFGILTVTSGKSVSIVDANDVALSDVSAKKGDVAVTALDGMILQMNDGSKIETGNATFSAAGDVLLLNEGNDFTGEVVVDASTAAIYDSNDLTLGDVSVEGGIYLDEQGQVVQTGVDAYANGRLTVKDGATVSTGGDGASIVLMSDSDSVQIDGDVTALGEVTLVDVSAAKDVVVSKGATVLAQGGGEINISTAMDKSSHGDVRIDGEVLAFGDGGRIEIRTGQNLETGDEYGRNGEGGSGDIEIGGTVGADGVDGRVMLYSANGKDESGSIFVRENGKVIAQGEGAKIQMLTGIGENSIGDIDISGTATVEGDGGALILATGNWKGGSGDIKVSGLAGAYGFCNDLEMTTGKSVGSKGGDINISGAVEADGIGGYAILSSATEAGTQGDVEISGRVKVTGEAAVAMIGAAEGVGAKGSVTVAKGGSVSLEGDGGSMVIRSAFASGTSGDVNIEGAVSMSGGWSDIRGEKMNTFLEVGSAIGEGSAGSIHVGGDVNIMGDSAGTLFMSGLGTGSRGDINVDGVINVKGENGRVDMVAASGVEASGAVSVSGAVHADASHGVAHMYAGYGDGAKGEVSVERGGVVSANGEGGEILLLGGYGTKARGTVDVDGVVSANGKGGAASVVSGFGSGASGGIAMNGKMTAAANAQLRTSSGDISIGGTVSSGGDALVLASGKSSGNIHFGAGGSVNAAQTADIISEGNVIQDGAAIVARNGYVTPVSVKAAVSAQTINLGVDGSLGVGNNHFGVNGKVYGVIGGSAAIAAVGNFKGGDSANAPTSTKISNIETSVRTIDKDGIAKDDKVTIEGLAKDFSALGGTASLMAGGNLSIYTPGRLEANGLLKANGNVTVSASSFGDLSYLQAGGKLTINNVGHPSHPQIAYFESINGVEPRINNLPNDMVIFVDGRLAGGNLQIINKFGATEAFPVSTPELKSEQGIFGNPVFLHGDLDVANPMAVGNVDYMLQEIPRLTLASDFPLEIDKSVNTAGLNPKDVYRFGQHPQVAEEKPQTEQEEKKDDKASAEKSAEPKVVMR